MKIANNLPALTALNSLGKNENELSKIIKQLSTGLRINSASDDAAGFAISEKMRSQISGLDVALRNSQDGISFLQTADGALGETNSMLQRMRELAVQASNDSLTSNDRQYLQLEIDELKKQIDKISGTTQFNKKRLLDGSSGALWSSDDMNVKAKINGGLTYVDDFGQKVSTEGNYRIEIQADGGQSQVQKSNIFNIHCEETIQTTKTEIIERIIGYEDKDFTYQININDGVDTLGQTSGEGWTFSAGTLNILDDGEYYIFGTGSITDNHIVINPSVKATIILDNVKIQTEDYPPFNMSEATVDMYLKGTNSLVCKEDSFTAHGAGLQTSNNSNLTISSFDGDFSTSGTLYARGNDHGAGIGGACPADNPSAKNYAGTITIKGGTIIATGGEGAAGIGGGINGVNGISSTDIFGSYTKITIDGGNINAIGGKNGGSGIGTAGDISSRRSKSNNGKIIINGGIVEANTTGGGAGIGGGKGFNSGTIEISSNASVTTTGYTDLNQTESIGYGEGGSSRNVKYTDATPPEARDSITKIPIKERETIITEATEITPSYPTLKEISNFYNPSGKFLISQPQTLRITQGNGKTASVTLYEHDTMQDVAKKINDAIADDLGQARYTNNKNKFCTISDGTENSSESVYEKNPIYDDDGNLTGYEINATMLIRSAIPGKEGEIYFSGDEDLLNALGLSTIQESEEAKFTASVYDAHTGKPVAVNVKSSAPEFKSLIPPEIDIEVDAMAGLKSNWDENTKKFINARKNVYSAMLHLKNNGTIFQVGANQGEDFLIQLGDSSGDAIGISNVNVLTRETASRAIGVIDNAISKISAQRAKIGAYQNALEHTIENLMASNTNLISSVSRIRDADIAKTMMELVKLQILNQSGTSMLAQANQMPQSVLNLLQ